MAWENLEQDIADMFGGYVTPDCREIGIRRGKDDRTRYLEWRKRRQLLDPASERAYRKRYRDKLKADPERLAAILAVSRAYDKARYQKNREAILARRRARRAEQRKRG